MDKYIKKRKIGEGSFGKALLVEHKQTGKLLVVKEINMSRMARKEREEARKETAVLAQLGHPNIVTYRESFEEIGNLYIAMDYCDGGDLYGKINAQRGILFNEDQVLDWFVQSCLAIKHIHDRKILHRDIKSQNIFLTRHGIVKLGDFGIAKVLNSTVELARTCIGTPYYLSPEICENRPYNNKSDIWSLGCVLYELITLKHAFEAGNMKNLVLKIIRGSYPPPSPKYSYDLRALVSLLFKRNARDRPSINTVLKKPLLQSRIKKFLSDSEVQDEFSHTVMHGLKIQKQVPVGGARPLPPKPVMAKRPPSASPTPRYNAANVYAPSVARKSASKENRKSSEVRKSAGAKRPSSAGRGAAAAAAAPAGAVAMGNQDLVRRRQELMEKERKRREEAKNKEKQYAKQHQVLIDKQKATRMNRAREEGWKNLMSSLSSEDSDKKPSRNKNDAAPGAKRSSGPTPRKDEVRKPSAGVAAAAPPKFQPAPALVPVGKDPGSYEQYHAYLDKLQQQKQEPNSANSNSPASDRPASAQQRGPALGVAGALGAGGGAAARPPPPVVFNPGHAAKQGQAAGARGADAAGKARLFADFQARKQAAAANKARGHGDIFGAPAKRPVSAAQERPKPSPSPSPGRPISAREAKNKQEDDYLSRLRQIRLQNFNERKSNKNKLDGRADPQYKPPSAEQAKHDPELRRKKLEALRAQADDRAKRLKEELEKKRKEAYEFEQKRLKDKGFKPRTPDKPPKPVVAAKPAPPVPMTEAMRAIGVVVREEPPKAPLEKCPIGMTAAMQAIGAGPAVDQDQEAGRSPLQKKKDDILKRLNSKPLSQPQRAKWGEPVKPPAEMHADRLKWGEADAGALQQITLEETGSHMDETSARDVVVKHLDYKEGESAKQKQQGPKDAPGATPATDAPQQTPRRHWGVSKGTVLNALENAQITDAGTVTVTETVTAAGAVAAKAGGTITIAQDEVAQGKAPVIGSTITVERNVSKGTVVIKKMEPAAEKPLDEATGENVGQSKDGSPGADKARSRSPSPKPKSKSRSPSPKPPAASEPEKSKSALFDKVELDEDEDEERGKEQDLAMEDLDEVQAAEPLRQDKPTDKDHKLKKSDKKESSLVFGLTTGHFDVDVKLLRTCSEPDLSKLFKTLLAENPFSDASHEVASSLNCSPVDRALALEAAHVGGDEEEGEVIDDVEDEAAEGAHEDGERGKDEAEEGSAKVHDWKLGELEEGEIVEDDSEDDDQEEATEEGRKEDEDDSEPQEEDEDEDEEAEGGDSEEDDMETLRESMMSILTKEDNEEDEELCTTPKKKTKKGSKKGKKIKKKKAKETEEKKLTRQWSDSSVEDFKSMRETMQSLVQPTAPSKKVTPMKTVDEKGDGTATNDDDVVATGIIVPGRESWQSDDDEDDDDYFEEEDMFSRLEESRAKLESELGCENFLKAYKTVQNAAKAAIHEDEDENMEQGIALVSQILGHDKVHLYPTILQLVMADGAFTEDND